MLAAPLQLALSMGRLWLPTLSTGPSQHWGLQLLKETFLYVDNVFFPSEFFPLNA